MKKLFPHKNTVEEARAVLENISELRPTHIGEDLDAENELENEAAVLEDIIEDLEYAGRCPPPETTSERESASTSKSTKGSGGHYLGSISGFFGVFGLSGGLRRPIKAMFGAQMA